jgi:hypothetical protein
MQPNISVAVHHPSNALRNAAVPEISLRVQPGPDTPSPPPFAQPPLETTVFPPKQTLAGPFCAQCRLCASRTTKPNQTKARHQNKDDGLFHYEWVSVWGQGEAETCLCADQSLKVRVSVVSWMNSKEGIGDLSFVDLFKVL